VNCPIAIEVDSSNLPAADRFHRVFAKQEKFKIDGSARCLPTEIGAYRFFRLDNFDDAVAGVFLGQARRLVRNNDAVHSCTAISYKPPCFAL
jgi:hypothetical protein